MTRHANEHRTELQDVRDCFLDTRALLEPAGALSVAGLKQYCAAHGVSGDDAERPNYVCIGSDAANVEFDFLARASEAK